MRSQPQRQRGNEATGQRGNGNYKQDMGGQSGESEADDAKLVALRGSEEQVEMMDVSLDVQSK